MRKEVGNATGMKHPTTRCSIPMLWADTVGGNLKSEQYYFAGGYARQTGRFTFGVDASYCANIEYRNADPRPKNLTGDLNESCCVVTKLGASYVAGVSLRARKYKQTNELVFYNELGVPNILHLTGWVLIIIVFVVTGEKRFIKEGPLAEVLICYLMRPVQQDSRLRWLMTTSLLIK